MPEASADTVHRAADDVGSQLFIAPHGIRLRWWDDDDLAVVYDGILARTHLISALASAVIGATAQQPVRVDALRQLLGVSTADDDGQGERSSAFALLDETVAGLVDSGLLIRHP